MLLVGVLLIAFGYESLTNGQPSDGLILLCAGGIVLLIAAVYSTDWFEDVDNGLRIIQFIFLAALIGGIFGFVLYGPKESIVAALLVGFAAEIAGVFLALYFYFKSKQTQDTFGA